MIVDALTMVGTSINGYRLTAEELLVETSPRVTPPQGLAVLRALEDDPEAPVTVHRRPDVADYVARVLKRTVRLRVKR